MHTWRREVCQVKVSAGLSCFTHGHEGVPLADTNKEACVKWNYGLMPNCYLVTIEQTLFCSQKAVAYA